MDSFSLGLTDLVLQKKKYRKKYILVKKSRALFMLWSGLDSRVGALHRVNLIAPYPLEQNRRRKITMNMTMTKSSLALP